MTWPICTHTSQAQMTPPPRHVSSRFVRSSRQNAVQCLVGNHWVTSSEWPVNTGSGHDVTSWQHAPPVRRHVHRVIDLTAQNLICTRDGRPPGLSTALSVYAKRHSRPSVRPSVGLSQSRHQTSNSVRRFIVVLGRKPATMPWAALPGDVGGAMYPTFTAGAIAC